MKAKNRKEQTESSVKTRTASKIKKNFRENPNELTGGEIEDALHHRETLEAAGNEEVEETFQNIYEDARVDVNRTTVPVSEDEEALIGVEVQDSPFVLEEDGFKPKIDTDFSPHQGEVAGAPVDNPGDLLWAVERPRRIRDRNLPEGYSSFEYGLKPEVMFPDVNGPHNRQELVNGEAKTDESHRRPKPRYLGFVQNDGAAFHAMGAPKGTQGNNGTPVGEELSTDQFFYEMFNGGEKASLPEISPALSSLFVADGLFSKNGGEYEIEVEAGRDMIYDLFVSESNAVSRKEAEERWGDVLDQALPTNENYGRIEDLTQIRRESAVEDFVDVKMSRPAKLAPEVNPSQIRFENPQEVLDEGVFDEENNSLEYLQERDEEREQSDQWVLFDQERQEMNIKQLEEERKYKGKMLLDGEIVDVIVDHSEMDEDEFEDLMDGYMAIQNTMSRSDVAAKIDGIVESRNFTHSDRSHHALLTQKAMVDKYQKIQEKFYEAGVTSSNAEEMRNDFVRNGLDTKISSYDTNWTSESENSTLGEFDTLREFYRFELLPVLEEGVREGFEEKTPYVVQKLAENEEYNDFEEVMSQFDSFGDLLEYQDINAETRNDPHSDYDEESEIFAEWFAETYREDMEHWLDPETPTVNEELMEYANVKTPEDAIKTKERASHHNYEATK